MIFQKRLMKLTLIVCIVVITAVLPPTLYTLGQGSSILQKSGLANHWVEWVIRLNQGQQLKMVGSCTDASGTGISYIHEFHVDMRQADPGVPSDFPKKFNYFDCRNVNATFTVPYSGLWVFYFHVHTNSVPENFKFNYTINVTDQGGSPSPTPTPPPANRAPTAVNDSVSVPRNGTATIFLNTLLGNDSDPDNDPLTITGSTSPVNGSLTRSSATSAVYRPRTNFTGTDSFTYTISDGRGGSATGTVNITVGP